MPDETEYDFRANFDIQELVDEEGLQELFDAFYAATGIAASIISLEGRVLAGAGWQRICIKFHRKLPASKRLCLENDTRLNMELVQTCRETIQRCPHGLMSAAVPILIDGRHMANLFSGEFLPKPPDTKIIAEFKARADRFGFDLQDYLSALSSVPIIPERRVPHILQFLKRLAELIGELGFQQMQLRASEALYHQLFESANDAILIIRNGVIVDCNQEALNLTGISRKTLIGLTPLDVSPEVQPDGVPSKALMAEKTAIAFQDRPQRFDWRIRRNDSALIDVEVSLTRFKIGDTPHGLAIVRDVSERKKMVHALEARQQELNEKTRYLEKVNQALKASLDHREIEKRSVEEHLLVNLKRFVYPYLEELQQCRLDAEAKAYVNIISTHLNDLTAQVSKTLSAKYLDFTPTEIRIADLIRDGKSSKEIATLLSLSPSSIQWHRKNIREKLGLTHKKVNLSTYLASLGK